MRVIADIVLVLGLLAMVAVAGFFYAYACSVMPGLDRLSGQSAVLAMQAINATVRNGWFAASFFGALAFSGLALLARLAHRRDAATRWIGAGFALYALGGFGLTFLWNAPLNEGLAQLGTPLVDEAPRMWRDFHDYWVAGNLLRTAASFAAFLCLLRGFWLSARLRGA